jgi:DNA-binding beta-propeller fold protein YncE
MRLVRFIVLILCITSLLGQSIFAQDDSQRGRHDRLYVVPRPGEVKIDGDLSDWDLSGQIWVWVAADTAEMQSARFAAMYDDEALYLSAEVRDPSPLMNRHDPLVDPDSGWDADACQFRIVVDASQGWPVAQGINSGEVPNDQMLHLTLWQYTDEKKPAIHLVTGMNYAVPEGYPRGIIPNDKYEASYVPAKDGHGYIVEWRLPWTTLLAKKPPKAGDIVAGTVQFNWGRPDGLRTAGGNAWAYDVMCRPGFTFQESGCWGKIIFSPKGNLPREMVEEGVPPEPPLPLTFEYELPEDGEATVTLFDEAGNMVRTLVASGARRAGKNIERWDGLDDRGVALPAGKYTWKGLIHGPITTKYLLSLHNSGQPGHKTDDGTGGWGGDHGWPQDIALLGDDKILMCWNAAESGWGIIRTNYDGKKEWGTVSNSELLATSDDGKFVYVACTEATADGHLVRVLDAKDFRPINFGSGRTAVEPPPGTPQQVHFRGFIGGLDCKGDALYASVPSLNKVVVYDAAQGTIRTTWDAPNPWHLVALDDGSVLVVCGPAEKREVLRFTADGKSSPFIADHLDEATGIAVGPDGNIYVANRGKLHNVSVFDSSGKYLRSIGKPGGRPWRGQYDPSGMIMPRGIEVDRQNRLWVAEEQDMPKRISVWNTQDGSLLKEFFGGSAYATWVYMRPDREDIAYCHGVEWEIDLDKGTSRPLTTLWRADRDNPNMVGPMNVGGAAGHLRVIVGKNGHEYAVGQGQDYGQRVMIRDGDVFKPFIATIPNLWDNPYIPWPLYPALADKQKFKQGVYIWQDQDNDQCVDENEITLGEEWVGYFGWFDEECNAWVGRQGGCVIVKPTRFEPDGRPVYDLSPEHLDSLPKLPFLGAIGNMTGVWTNLEDPSDTSVYTIRAEAPAGATDPLLRHGMTRFTRDGKVLWNFQAVLDWHSAMNLGTAKAGKIWGPTSPLGVAGDFTGVATYFGSFHLLTRDGLYVAKIMKDGRLPGLGADVIAAECFTGLMVRTKGGRYLLLAGDQDGRITEILGLDTVKRLEGGSFTLSAEQVALAAQEREAYLSQQAKAQSLVIVRGGADAARLSRGIVKRSENDKFSAKFSYDGTNLYARYEVQAPYELVNSMSEANIVFRGGNCIDLQIATDPSAPADRTAPAPGDVRLLVTRQNDKPFAVLYRPKVAGFSGTPIVLTSPVDKESFDSIEVVSDRIQLDYRKVPAGFEAVVTIPLDLLGWKPQPGGSVRMDVGYIFGNATGTRAARRAYWSNSSFEAAVVDDIPDESRLAPKEWGTANVE